MAGTRRARSAAPGQIVDFFMTASEQARTVVEYFRSASSAEASAALAVAQTIVKQRQSESGTGDARVRSAGAGTQRASRRTSTPPAEGSTQRTQRVISTPA